MLSLTSTISPRLPAVSDLPLTSSPGGGATRVRAGPAGRQQGPPGEPAGAAARATARGARRGQGGGGQHRDHVRRPAPVSGGAGADQWGGGCCGPIAELIGSDVVQNW